MSNVIPLHPPAPFDEPVEILLDGNVKAVKLFKALAEAGFTFTFDRGLQVMRISERVSN
jgi:hypothetical protein